MKFEKATLPTQKNKLQQFALHFLILPCIVLPLISPVVEMSTCLIFLGGLCFWCFVRTTPFLIFCRGNLFYKRRTFSIFCGDDVLDQHITLAKTICVMDFVFDMVFLKGRPFGPKGHSGNHLWDNLRLGLAKKKGAEYPQGRPFGPKGHPFELAKF